MSGSRLSQGQYQLFLFIFVLSGFSGLIYQSAWSHYLGLFLGHAAYAQALVLALFMGGMAAGAALVGRYGERIPNLIRWYAGVEAVIGLLGLVFHWMFDASLALSYDQIMPALGGEWTVGLYKWTLAAALILPQTVLLGMTFPLMTGGIIRRFPGRDGRSLGVLYFTNSFGAALGVLVSAFILLPTLGLPGAMKTGGILNLVVALGAWLLSRGHGKLRPRADSASEKPGDGDRQAGSPILFVVLAATFLSSAASFAYEILFVRMLSLAVGTTLHAFELMLASFILGIAIGAFWIRGKADRIASPLKWVAILQVLMGLAALAAMVLYANAFAWVGGMMSALAKTDAGYSLFNGGTAFISLAIMFPTAFFAGTTLPLFTVALLRAGQGEKSISRVYAWNTLGAILGVFLAVHVLVPALGLKLSMLAAASLDILIGIVLLRSVVRGEKRYRSLAASVAAFMVAFIYVSVAVPFDPMRLSSGVFRSGHDILKGSDEVVYYRDGKTSSVAAIFNPDSASMRIATNGKVDAAIRLTDELMPTGDEPTMLLLGSLPLAYHQNAKDVAVIGFGSGLTTHTVLADSGVERVDTIEIEEAMVDGARAFGEKVARAYEDPRSNIVIDDAKSYFSGNQSKYDIIISEPSNPWISGVGTLFSREFYQFVPRFLNEGGVFVQWLQLYEISDELVSSVLNAMTPEFGDVTAYLANSTDLIIVASADGMLDSPNFERILSGNLGRDLRRIRVETPAHLSFRKVADMEMLKALGRLHGHLPANSDYYPVLSIEAPRTRFKSMVAGSIVALNDMEYPVLEWLGVRTVPSAFAELTNYGYANPVENADIAYRVLSYIKSGAGRENRQLPPEVSEWLEDLPLLEQSCSVLDKGRYLKMVQDIHYKLALQLIPYVGAADLEGVLIDPSWVNCDIEDEVTLDVIALVEASAKRDSSAMIELGKQWIESIDERSEGARIVHFDEYALLSVIFGLLGEERHDEVVAVDKEYGPLVEASDAGVFVRSLVLAWLDDE